MVNSGNPSSSTGGGACQSMLLRSNCGNQQWHAMQSNQQQHQQFMLPGQLQQQQPMVNRSLLPQQMGQFQHQSMRVSQLQLPLPTGYEPGTCARRLMQYLHEQKQRPNDNDIKFWKKFVVEYFAPNAKKRWCFSLYGTGSQSTGISSQNVWQCEICDGQPGHGFEIVVEVLPRLFQIKYATGILEELLYIDMPHEYQNALGQIVLNYETAIEESVFEQLRVAHEGQLRIVFNQDLKIASWEFCARRHEELIPRRLVIPQVGQLTAIAQRHQAAVQNGSLSSLSPQDLQMTCTLFLASTRQLAKVLEVPYLSELGYTKRYVRCLQISEVMNSMKDLIDYSIETNTGPRDSLVNFPIRTSSSSVPHLQHSRPGECQPIPQSSDHTDQASFRLANVLLAGGGNGISSVHNYVNTPSSTTTPAVTIAGFLPGNYLNLRQEHHIGTANSPHNGPPANPSSPFQPLTPSPSPHNPTQHGTPLSDEAGPSESQSLVQQILQGMVMPSQDDGTMQNTGIGGMGFDASSSGDDNNGMNMNKRMRLN